MNNVMFSAEPNPILTRDYSLGVTTLGWLTTASHSVEIRVDSPTGPLLHRGGSCGSVTTGAWVTDGMTFFLQDCERPESTGTSEIDRTLAMLRVSVVNERFGSRLSPVRQLRDFPTRRRTGTNTRVLIAGWFSFDFSGATAGDLLSLQVVTVWLDRRGCDYEVSLGAPFCGGVHLNDINPTDYTAIVFVCGPFPDNAQTRTLLDRFHHCRAVGVNLSMLQSLDQFNPFDDLLERDSSRGSRPDLAFLAERRRVPVIGVVLVEPVPEFPDRARHDFVNATISEMLDRYPAAIVEIDTRLDNNATGLRTGSEVESLIAKMDAVITTRLHGLVLSLRNGVPVVAIDPHSGGSKVMNQAQTLSWPAVIDPDQLDVNRLRRDLEWCLTEEGRALASGMSAYFSVDPTSIEREFEAIVLAAGGE